MNAAVVGVVVAAVDGAGIDGLDASAGIEAVDASADLAFVDASADLAFVDMGARTHARTFDEASAAGTDGRAANDAGTVVAARATTHAAPDAVAPRADVDEAVHANDGIEPTRDTRRTLCPRPGTRVAASREGGRVVRSIVATAAGTDGRVLNDAGTVVAIEATTGANPDAVAFDTHVDTAVRTGHAIEAAWDARRTRRSPRGMWVGASSRAPMPATMLAVMVGAGVTAVLDDDADARDGSSRTIERVGDARTARRTKRMKHDGEACAATTEAVMESDRRAVGSIATRATGSGGATRRAAR